MVKVITIKDDVYKKLLRLKRKRGESFSEVIEYLLNYSARGEHARSLVNLAGSIGERSVRKDRLRRVLKW